MPGVLHCALSGALLSSGIPMAAEVECVPGVLSVETRVPNAAGMACEGAKRAIDLLAACGIRVRAPLRVDVVDSLDIPRRANELGYFDVTTSRAVVLDFERCRQVVGPAGRFGVPMAPDLYRSLVSHELAHAIVAQQERASALRRVAHEYLAYVVQFQSMDRVLRDEIMSRYPHDGPVALDELSELYLDLSPPDFAVKAYRHFTSEENGCRFARQLVNGVTVLPTGL